MTGRRVVITGAAHGIGAACASAFVDAGDRVVIADIDDEAASMAFHLDVARSEDWDALAEVLRDDPPEAVVNNAYRLEVAAAHELSETSWHAQLDVTLGGVYRSVRTFHRDLAMAGGAVVNVASVHGLAGWPGHPAYAAAKGGILALTRQLANDYGPEIRVNAVVPGPILTRAWDPHPQPTRERVAAHTALKRLGRPEEVADAVAFLAGPRASYITGTHLVVDGGQTSTMQ
jgi:NAD(P)-dependent dehydrogenase (short-subunit alcohol dehydrogenase family)